MRLFVAVGLSKEILAEAASLLAQLAREVPGVRWARPESLHVTLRFLGEVGAERVDAVSAALEGAAAGGVAPFPLEVSGLGTFGEGKRPRVVWAGVHERSGALADLQAGIERACGEMGFAAEARPFSAHLTLARLKGAAPLLGRALATRSAVRLGGMDVGSFSLIRSELKPGGALYTPLRSFALRAPGGESGT